MPLIFNNQQSLIIKTNPFMNYYYFHGFFPPYTPPSINNEPYIHEQITTICQQQKIIPLKIQQVKIKMEHAQLNEIKAQTRYEEFKSKKIKKQLKALCPELNRQVRVQKVNINEETGVIRQSKLSNKVRNSNSNLMRMFFRKMEQIFEYDHYFIEKIIAKNKINTTVKMVQEWFEVRRAECTRYVRLRSVRGLFFSSKGHKQETKVMRILMNNFLRNEALRSYLTSKKIRKELMSYNLKSIRTILFDLNAAEVE